VICEIELPAGASLASGRMREDVGQLEGRAYKPAAVTVWSSALDPTDDRARVDWVVRLDPSQAAGKSSRVKITARHERAGTVRVEIGLK
jgi:hypothetical protein